LLPRTTWPPNNQSLPQDSIGAFPTYPIKRAKRAEGPALLPVPPPIFAPLQPPSHSRNKARQLLASYNCTNSAPHPKNQLAENFPPDWYNGIGSTGRDHGLCFSIYDLCAASSGTNPVESDNYSHAHAECNGYRHKIAETQRNRTVAKNKIFLPNRNSPVLRK
jgi:hypothetical protein